MRKASLCSGIGGIDLAAHWVGMETVVFCERKPFPQRVLRARWPGIAIIDDIYEFSRERLLREGIIDDGRAIDIISAGYPCQPFSHAGKRAGENDDRHLWPEVKRVIREIRPRWVVLENVAGHISLGLDTVLADLASEDYEAIPIVLPVAGVYGTHKRERVFIVGYTECSGFDGFAWGRADEEPTHGHFGDEKQLGGMGNSQIDDTRRLPIREGAENSGLTRASQDVANAASSGLPKRRQSGRSESQEETGARAINGLERCRESLADAEGERPSETRECSGRSEEWAPCCGSMADAKGRGREPRRTEQPGQQRSLCVIGCGPSCGGGMAHTGGTRCKELDAPSFANRSGHSSGGDDAGRDFGSAQSVMGRNAHGLPDWLDGCGLNPLDALADFIANYPQPAPRGVPQFDWEPPRVAEGVKDRVGRLEALGNAVNPLQILPIMYAIKVIDDWMMRVGQI